jgi:hypothetical protein
MARPTGARDKLKNNFVVALHDDFQQHGIEAIVAMRESDPAAYINCIAKILPKELEIRHSNPFEDLTDEQLDAIIQLASATGGTGSAGTEASKESAPKPSELH